ncbi:MAG: protein-tyrosine phosphatase family protein [Acidiferrobacterales bacterium]
MLSKEGHVVRRFLPAELPQRVGGIALRLLLMLVVLAAPVYVFLSNFATFEPYLYPLHLLQGNVRKVTPDVIVGPYPDYGLISDLHERGVHTIISLLDENLIYERSLIEREDLYTEQMGIKEYNFPMDSSQPPNSRINAAALRHIVAYIGSHPDTKIYIHCYLGKHRVGDVVRMLQTQHRKETQSGDRLRREGSMVGR